MSKPIIKAGDQAFLESPVARVDGRDLERLFLDSAKPDNEWFVGTEIELFGFDEKSLAPADHSALTPILDRIGEMRGWSREYEKNGALVGLKGDGQSVSLEPGGQIEFATRPHRQLKALRNEMLQYCDDLRALGRERNIGFWCMGHQPFVHLDGAPHMPKPRYEMMRSYLRHRGARALEMMHLTGSIQCTVDFLDEENLVKKVRTAARASAFLSALVAASPFTRGAPNGYRTLRYQVWLETDDERCGIWPEMLDAEGLTVSRYIRRAMKAAPMFFIRDEQFIRPDFRPFESYVASGFQDTDVTVKDFLDHLTTFFPEVRPKGYVELRGADCLPPPYVAAVAGFWRGILDHEPTRQRVDDRLSSMGYEDVRALQPEVARHGLDAMSAAGPVREVIRELVETSHQRLLDGTRDCAECLQPLRELAEKGRSPADEMLETAERVGVSAALEWVRI